MTILQQKKVILENYVTTRKNHDSSRGVYLTAAKVTKFRLLADNRREK